MLLETRDILERNLPIPKVVIACFVFAIMGGSSLLGSDDGDTESSADKVRSNMKIKYASVFVNDQSEALEFYTKTLGFVEKAHIPLGEFKWLTVVSPADPDGTELLLEPNANDAAKTFQQAIFEQGIPATLLVVDEIQKEFERLTALGVKFTVEPTDVGGATIAIFDDTCGNLIQIAQM